MRIKPVRIVDKANNKEEIFPTPYMAYTHLQGLGFSPAPPVYWEPGMEFTSPHNGTRYVYYW